MPDPQEPNDLHLSCDPPAPLLRKDSIKMENGRCLDFAASSTQVLFKNSLWTWRYLASNTERRKLGPNTALNSRPDSPDDGLFLLCESFVGPLLLWNKKGWRTSCAPMSRRRDTGSTGSTVTPLQELSSHTGRPHALQDTTSEGCSDCCTVYSCDISTCSVTS